jgi:hypothetical protein
MEYEMSEQENAVATPVVEAPVTQVAPVTNKTAAPEATRKASVQAPTSTDPRVTRRAELKREKRRAHRHKINASNRPG